MTLAYLFYTTRPAWDAYRTPKNQIEQYVSIYLKISDMAVILGISATQLREDIADKSTEVSRRYHRGKAASRVKLLHQEMQLAYVSSPLALENTRNNLLDMEDDE